MSELQLKVGDVVVLKTGSVKMNVQRIIPGVHRGDPPNGFIECAWMDGTEKKEDTFRKESLRISEP